MIQDPNMKLLLYTVSVLMVIAWALSYFVYSLDTTAHFLLLIGLVTGFAGILQKEQ